MGTRTWDFAHKSALVLTSYNKPRACSNTSTFQTILVFYAVKLILLKHTTVGIIHVNCYQFGVRAKPRFHCVIALYIQGLAHG